MQFILPESHPLIALRANLSTIYEDAESAVHFLRYENFPPRAFDATSSLIASIEDYALITEPFNALVHGIIITPKEFNDLEPDMRFTTSSSPVLLPDVGLFEPTRSELEHFVGQYAPAAPQPVNRLIRGPYGAYASVDSAVKAFQDRLVSDGFAKYR